MANAGSGRAPDGDPGARRSAAPRRGRAFAWLKPVDVAAVALIAILALLVGVIGGALWSRDDHEVPGGVEIPDLVGERTSDARRALEDLGLLVDEREVPEEPANEGVVVGQDPGPGASVEQGSVVRLNVGVVRGASAAKLVTVPDVRGKQRDDAIAKLEALGLSPATDRVPRDDVPSGEVVEQRPAPGTDVSLGTQVLLGIARKPAPKSNVIAWVLGLGPGAPEGPPEFRAYQLLLDPDDCPKLKAQLDAGEMAGLAEDAVRLYEAAADACLAAFHHQPARWTNAGDALATLERPDSCIDASAYRLLRRLVKAHRENEKGEFRVSGKPGTEAPCPANAKLHPRHGPLGSQVRVTADHIDGVEIARVKFLVDGELVNGNGSIDPSRDGDSITLTVDAGSEVTGAQWACVYLEATQDWNATGAWFAIDPPPEVGASGPTGEAVPSDVACPPPSGT